MTVIGGSGKWTFSRVKPGKNQSVPVPAAPIVVTLGALTGTFTLAENASAGASAGALSGRTSGSTLTLTDDAGGRVALSGTTIIRGATALNYEASASHNFTVREVLSGATNTPNSTVLTLTVTDIAEGGAPANTVAPVITGDAVVGQVLYGSDGTWTESPTSYSRQWYEDAGSGFAAIDGATSDAYLVNDIDVGKQFKFGVAATNGLGSSSVALSSATSAATQIDLTDAVTLTRASASGAALAITMAFGANVYGDGSYFIRLQECANTVFAESSLVQDVDYRLTDDDLETGAPVPASIAAAAAAVGLTNYVRIVLYTTSPNGMGFRDISETIQPTDAPPTAQWSVAGSHASWGFAGAAATSGAGFDTIAKADASHSGTGDWSFTITMGQSPSTFIGLANASQSTADFLGDTSNSLGWRNTDGLGVGTGGVNASFSWTTGDVIKIRLKNNKLYIAKNGTYSTGMDPVAETGGIDVSGKGALFPAISTNGSARIYTGDFTGWPV